MIRRLGAILIAGVLLAVSIQTAEARPHPRHFNVSGDQAAADGVLPLQRIVLIIRNRCPGSILDAQRGRLQNGTEIYRVKWRSKSDHVLTFIVDAKNGHIISQQGQC